MNFYAGVDGGGTKTAVLCVDELGRPLAERTFGPFNINSIGAEGLRRVMNEILAFLNLQGDCISLCIGAAGNGNAALRDELSSVMSGSGIARWQLVGDYEIALAGALNGRTGLALVAGTGSVCSGRNGSGRLHRVGGWGHLIGDEGSGYTIGRDALKHLVNVRDGLEPPSALAKAVEEDFSLHSRNELVAFVYGRDKSAVASVSAAVLKEAELGDAAALSILRNNADSLGKLCRATAEELQLSAPEIALLGGLIDRSTVYRPMVIDAIHRLLPDAVCISPEHSPAVGAVLLAGAPEYKEETRP